MPVGTISSSYDTVGVSVVNYQVPICESRDDVINNCHKISKMVEGLKRGYPGLDLVIFPEYSTQGFHPHKWGELTTTLDGPEVDIFKKACVDNGVFGIFSLTGEEHPEGKNPFNTLIMISDEGEIVLTYRKMFPWCPLEPWTAGHETSVAVGPKGMVVGATICYDLNLPEIMRDTVMKGAELVVRIQGYMYPAKQQQIQIANVRACYFGHSNIISFDGTTLAECETTPDEATYAELSLTAIRNARRNWTAENHLYNLVHRGYTSEAGGHAPCPFQFYRDWVNAPHKAKTTAELLTRDTDSPLKCSFEDVPVMKPSRLAEESLHAPRAESTGRIGQGKDAGKHGYVDDDVSVEEAGRWKDGLPKATTHHITAAA